MPCDRIEQWLNEGLPAAGEHAARLHAAECPSCARALAAATEMERALAAAPPLPPGGADAFVARVLEKIQREPAAAPAPARVMTGKFWWGLLSEPAFVVGAVALFLVAFVPAITRQEAGHSVAIATTIAFQALGAVLENLVGTSTGPFSGLATLGPVARATVLACFLVLLGWAGMWATSAVDRWLRPGPGRRV